MRPRKPRKKSDKALIEELSNLLDGERRNTELQFEEALMRSRYTAYTLGREDYLLATWHRAHRPVSLGLANEPGRKWLGLEVRRHELTGPDDAVVEFVARYKVNGRACRLHEISCFVREAEQWCYVEGDIV
jgi:SEC-C motif-containing protein